MWFDSIEAVQRFAGPNYEEAVVPPEARKLLRRFDRQSAHFNVIERQPTTAERPVPERTRDDDQLAPHGHTHFREQRALGEKKMSGGFDYRSKGKTVASRLPTVKRKAR